MEVALRYVGDVATSMPKDIAEHAAESVVWDLCKPREAGSLDWPRGVRGVEWPELSKHLLATGTSTAESAPAYQLARLTAVRVRAWVAMMLSAHGPELMAAKRKEDDWQRARERFEDIQAFDIGRFRTQIENELEKELGAGWCYSPAACRVFQRLVAQQEAYKRATVEDFYKEVSSFLPDRYSLTVEPCEECIRLKRSVGQIDQAENALPPFHLTCSCEVSWHHDWVFSNDWDDGKELDAEVKAWTAKNVQGLSVGPPSIRDMLRFEEARMRDEKHRTESRSDENVTSTDVSLWRRLAGALKWLGRSPS